MPAPTDNEAFTCLYIRHVEQVYRYHLARTGSTEAAEDLTAETFFAALASFERLDGAQPALPWLFGIARHKLGDHRRRAFFRGLPRALRLEGLPNLPAPAPSPEDQAAHRLDVQRVARALHAINALRAEAVALHYYGGLSMQEVGETLGKSEEAAKKLVQRGLAELRKKMEG